MITVFALDVPPICQRCPKGQTEQTCALRQHLNSDNSVYEPSPYNDHKLSPKTNDWAVIRDAIDELYKICAKCQSENNQKTK